MLHIKWVDGCLEIPIFPYFGWWIVRVIARHKKTTLCYFCRPSNIRLSLFSPSFYLSTCFLFVVRVVGNKNRDIFWKCSQIHFVSGSCEMFQFNIFVFHRPSFSYLLRCCKQKPNEELPQNIWRIELFGANNEDWQTIKANFIFFRSFSVFSPNYNIIKELVDMETVTLPTVKPIKKGEDDLESPELLISCGISLNYLIWNILYLPNGQTISCIEPSMDTLRAIKRITHFWSRLYSMKKQTLTDVSIQNRL